MAKTILTGPIRKVTIPKVKFEDLRIFLLPGQPGSTLKNIKKFFFKIFFMLKTFLNGPIRKVIMVKVKFEDLCIFLPGHPSSTQRKFLEKYE